jgi:hypothetical protein
MHTQDIPFGYCHCGCGEKPGLARTNDAYWGYVAGMPLRYLPGHQRRKTVAPLCGYVSEALGYDTDCWIWQLSVTVWGYAQGGQPQGGRQHGRVHVDMWESRFGPVPKGMELDHLCHTADVSCVAGNQCRHRRCVNPEHLELVTSAINSQRGRAAKLTPVDVGVIRRLVAGGRSQASVSRTFGVHVMTINDIIRGRTWVGVGH